MHWSHEKCFKTMAEYLALLPENARAACDLGWPKDIPVIVLTVAWAKLELPEYVEHRVAAKSGHWIQLDEPELVIDSVRDGLARAGALQSSGR
jgi:pimeloyl-ACP methyl ester carboxylesterase